MDTWLADSVRDTVRENSFERYEQITRRHIKPMLGSLKLKSLTPTHLRSLYRKKLDSGLAPRTVQYIHVTLHKALKQAVLDGLIPRNVAAAVKSPKPTGKEIRVLNTDEVRAFLDAARGDRFYPLFVLAISTGMREGELLGLRWADLNLEAGKLSVRRSLTITKKNGVGFSDTKRKKSRRSIKLSRKSLDALASHRARQNEERLRLGSAWQDDDLVFPAENGSPMRPWSLTSGSFKRTLRRAGLPEDITFHEATRHTAATLLLGKGVHPKLVQELLGHASIGITLDTYSHVLPGMDDGLAATMEEAIS
jgi:integrase